MLPHDDTASPDSIALVTGRSCTPPVDPPWQKHQDVVNQGSGTKWRLSQPDWTEPALLYIFGTHTGPSLGVGFESLNDM